MREMSFERERKGNETTSKYPSRIYSPAYRINAHRTHSYISICALVFHQIPFWFWWFDTIRFRFSSFSFSLFASFYASYYVYAVAISMLVYYAADADAVLLSWVYIRLIKRKDARWRWENKMMRISI